MQNKWELKSHNYQIADTGDYDGVFELTNGKISLYTKEEDEEYLTPIVNALNDSGVEFYLDDSVQFELYLLKKQIEAGELIYNYKEFKDEQD